MKIFKNESQNGGFPYYSTSFYSKTTEGEELRKKVFVYFAKGCEPTDTIDGTFVFKTNDGEEYDVILSAYKSKQDNIEPKFILYKNNDNRNNSFNYNNNDDEINDDDLPF